MTNLAPEQKDLIQSEILPLQHRTAALVVKTPEERAALVVDVKNAEDLKTRIEERFHPTANRKAADEARDAARDTEKQFYDPIDAFVKNAKVAVKTFDTNEAIRIQREAQEREEKRLNDERVAQAKKDAEAVAAKKQADDEALAEFVRLEEEKKKNQAILDQATAAGNSKVAGIAAANVEKIATEIQETEAAHERKIDEITQKVENPPAPKPSFTPPPQPVKKLIWKARVTNVQALCRSVAAGVVPFSVIDVRVSQLNDFAKGYDGKSRVEGLEFYQESSGRL